MKKYYVVKDDESRVVYRGEDYSDAGSAMDPQRSDRYKVCVFEMDKEKELGLNVMCATYFLERGRSGEKEFKPTQCSQNVILGKETLEGLVEFLQENLK